MQAPNNSADQLESRQQIYHSVGCRGMGVSVEFHGGHQGSSHVFDRGSSDGWREGWCEPGF